MIASLDFETYSEAGFLFDGERWRPLEGTMKSGLMGVGADVYAEHPSADVLIACYSFDGGISVKTWVPGMPNPEDLLHHVRTGGLVQAFNSMFEWLLWDRVCRRRYDWPELPLSNMRDTMAHGRAYGLPGKLANQAKALGTAQQKDSEGISLIRRFCVPRSPTKNDPSLRHYMGADHPRAQKFYQYCAQDVRTETSVGLQVPELSGYELEVWKMDQEVNERGMAIDHRAVGDCVAILAGISEKLNLELAYLTNGRVQSSGQVAKIQAMLTEYGIPIADTQAETIKAILDDGSHLVHAHPWARRVLEIRQDLASASVKKLHAFNRYMCADGRVRGLFMYCGAERTGRWAGRGIQVHNLPRGAAKVAKCSTCGKWYGAHVDEHCGLSCGAPTPSKWSPEAVRAALTSFRDRDVEAAIVRWGDVLAVIGGCLRALLVAAPGHRLICSDYRAIEAVVLAALAGEQWRLDVFNTHGKIYEQSASKITGISFEEYVAYKQRTGEHHPTRNSIGKVAELASGYGGGIGAWKQFGADKHLTDDEIELNVKRWRDESPAIIRMWKRLESAAILAIENPGYAVHYRRISYHSDGRVLRCTLPSGRSLFYHKPSVEMELTPWGALAKRIKFFGHNSNPKYGAIGWHQLSTYGGRLTENVVQAVARDILAHGLLNLRAAGYHIVAHIHDEVVCEEPEGFGTIEDVEQRMGDLPAWAKGWPVIAEGGWIGREYRKD